MNNFRYQACLHFIQMAKIIQDHFRNELKKADLNFTELSVLVSLEHEEKQAVQQISQSVSLTSGALTYVLDKLEKKKLLIRTPCISDRRVIFVQLTDKGKALVEYILPNLYKFADAQLDLLTMDDADKLEKLVMDISTITE
ncbi:MarR family winged helix-turn-helix transcriptional regulator [Paenibacillus sp. W2I17]|uniref:MarR family winged helix-turn-helix transcriptional regulator n=1 Tax=Paenibacillus sp. W2I17 TaxID=3042311 RepID=UPI002782FB2C|nr:MarR family transcriptional regulator [Paenibacillus sp. W2I17]MDQ0656045.1 MarR family 2-MHQ and catechol resistance regulon transcriptional repressor [Paenibacillus sp. W2I17]